MGRSLRLIYTYITGGIATLKVHRTLLKERDRFQILLVIFHYKGP